VLESVANYVLKQIIEAKAIRDRICHESTNLSPVFWTYALSRFDAYENLLLGLGKNKIGRKKLN
jgi:hypothetical protein